MKNGGFLRSKLLRLFVNIGVSILLLLGLSPGAVFGSQAVHGHEVPVQLQPPIELSASSSQMASIAVDPDKDAEIISSSGRIKLALPKGAVLKPTNVELSEHAPIGSTGMRMLSFFELNAWEIDSDKKVETFAKTLRITIEHEPEELSGLDVDSLRLYYLDEATRQWLPVSGSSYDQEKATLTADLTHFSLYGEQANPLAAGPGRVMAPQVNLHSGTAVYSYPLELPPGPGGFQPGVELVYNSGSVDEMKSKRSMGSWVGAGWSLHFGRITRDLATNQYALDLRGASYRLASSDGANFRTNPDQYFKITRSGNTWELLDREGTYYRFGGTTDSEQYVGSDYYRWDLTVIRDINGNEADVAYVRTIRGTPPNDWIRSAYPEYLTYDNVEVHFASSWDEDDPTDGHLRKDSPKTYGANPAPKIMENRKLDSIEIRISSSLVRKYSFAYATADRVYSSDYGGVYYSGKHTLTSVTQVGADGTSQLPATSFTYQDLQTYRHSDERDYSGDPGNPASFFWPHLTEIDTGYGGTLGFSYTQTPDTSVEDIWTREVVTTKTVSDGVGASQTYTYTYTDTGGSTHPGTSWFQRYRGFDEVKETDGAGNYVRHWFYTTGEVNGKDAEKLSGREYRTQWYDSADTLLRERVYDWSWKKTGIDSNCDYVATFGSNSDLQATDVSADGYVYVADYLSGANQSQIHKYDSYGNHIAAFGSLELIDAKGVAVSADGYVYVANTGDVFPQSYVVKYDADGNYIATFGSHNDLQAIDVSADGHIYVAEYFSSAYGSQTSMYAANGDYVGSCRAFDLTYAKGLAVPDDGYVYMSGLTSDFPPAHFVKYSREYGALQLDQVEETIGSKTSRTRFVYDDYGNVVTEYLDGDILTSDDDATVHRVLYPSTTTNILSRPARERVYATITDDVGGANLKQESLFYYDGSNTSWTTPPTKGNLTRLERKKDASNSVSSYFTYDTYGNRLTEQDPNGNTTTWTYETTHHTYPATKTYPATGLSESYSYDAGTGNLLSLTDVNGQTTAYEYDTFKRLTKVIKPGDSSQSPSIERQHNSWGTLNQQHLKTLTKIEAGDYLWRSDYFDGLGRVVQTHARGETGRTIISSTTAFNSRGLVDKQHVSQDLDSAEVSGYEAPDAGWKYATYAYDGLGRATTETGADGTSVSYDHSSAWQTLVTNQRGYKTRHYYDAFRRLVRVEELDGSHQVYATTAYGYDVLGNLVQVTDNDSNTTTMTYDRLSRKTAMTDPDMGSWTYGYDGTGNLTSQTDAKGQTVTLTYDALNRLTGKTYPQGSGMTDVGYTYDDTTGGNYGKGLRTGMTDALGATAYRYDTRGRLIEEKRTVDSVDYTTGFAYDGADRLQTVTYPNGDAVSQQYSSRGLPFSLAATVIDSSWITIPGVNAVRAMTPPAGQDGDFTNGEVYEYTASGAELGIGNHSFQFAANDGTDDAVGDTSPHSGPTIAMEQNEAPVLGPIGDKSVDEGELLEFAVSATDPDGDPLTYSASNLPTGATFDDQTRTFSWTPGFDQEGTYANVHFQVTDGELSDSEDITITVHAASASYDLTVGSIAGGSVTTPGEGTFTYDAGSVVDIVATPEADYVFINWAGDTSTIADPNASSTSITLDGNYSITANFAEASTQALTLQVVAGADDATETAREAIATADDLEVRSYPGATPYQRKSTGLRFQNVDVPQGAVVTSAYISIYAFNSASNDVNCSIYVEDANDAADFVVNPHIINETYRPRTTAYTSWIQDDVAVGTYVDSPSLNAVLQELFDRPAWAAGNSLAILMIANEDVDKSVRFWHQEKYLNLPAKLHIEYTTSGSSVYDLTTNSTTGGSVTTPGEGTFSYNQGQVVNLTATPDANYRFANWTGDISTIADSNAASTTITMNGDYSVSANVAPNGAPVLGPIGDKSVDEGELLEFAVSATDPDGDPLTYSASNLPAGATFDDQTRTFSWTPGFDQEGTYANVHFQATDGELSDSEDITITVANSNGLPVLSGGDVLPQSGDTAGQYVYSVIYTDADNDPPSSISVTINSDTDTHLSFDGVDDHVDFTDRPELDLTTALTLEGWFNIQGTAAADDYPRLISNGNGGDAVNVTGYQIFQVDNGSTDLVFLWGDGRTQSSGGSHSYYFGTSGQDRWYHLVATYQWDGAQSTVTLYRDGVSVGTWTDVGYQMSSPAGWKFLVGRGGWNGNELFYSAFDGQIDEVRVYDRVLDAAEVQENYTRGRAGGPEPYDTAGLVGWWHMDEGSGTMVNDETANDIDGTIHTSGSSVVDLVTSALYNQLGQVTEINLGNGLRTTFGYWDVGGTYDTVGGYFGRLWNIRTHEPGQGALLDTRHTWDAGGNLTQREDYLATETETFGYDFLDRLTSVSGPYSSSYAYNQIGNITSMNGASYTYGTKPHAVTAVGTTGYAYDDNGNMTTRGSQTLTWDVENRPVSVTGGASFVYDGDGDRGKKTEGGETVLYVNRYYEKNLTTGVVTTHYYLGDRLVAKREGTTLEYVHQDHLTGTALVSDTSGSQVGSIKYYPYGSTRSGSVPTDRKFTGQRLDATGLYYYNARYYDPAIGRFISADTVVQQSSTRELASASLTVNSVLLSGEADSSPPLNPQILNRYGYAIGNPLRYTDPTGFFSEAELNAAGICAGDFGSRIWWVLLQAESGTRITLAGNDNERAWAFHHDKETGVIRLQDSSGHSYDAAAMLENVELAKIRYTYDEDKQQYEREYGVTYVAPPEPSGINWGRVGQAAYGAGEVVIGLTLFGGGVASIWVSGGALSIPAGLLMYSGVGAVLSGVDHIYGEPIMPDLPLLP